MTLWAGALALVLCSSSQGSEPVDLNLEQFRGNVVVVDFWASWCQPCRRSIPWLNEMRARYGKQGLVVIGVNVDAKQSDAARFLREVPAEFDIVYDPSGQLAERYHVPGMPASFVYDRSGHLAEQHLGFRDADRAPYETTLQKLLASASNRN
jgi:YD repeat-containing protein